MATKVYVKWGKTKYEVQLDLSDKPITLKSVIAELSGVPPDRQTLMFGGIKIADEDWGRAKEKLKPNVTLMMLGSAEKLPDVPVQKVKFIEDMSENEKTAELGLSTGLENWENTCYVNATLQCLKVVPELKEALKSYSYNDPRMQTSQSLTTCLKHLYSCMDGGAPEIVDFTLQRFIKVLREAVPHFSKKDKQTGMFLQQDAHECWSAIINSLAENIIGPTKLDRVESFVDQYFGLQLQTRYKCVENSSESETQEMERSYQLSCFISQDVRYLLTGLTKGLEGTVEKASSSLGRNANYCKTSLISRLPAYLTIQFVRFFVGKAGDSDEVVSKKILKDVKFPSKLDLYDLCSSSLQEKLLPMRQKFKEVEDLKMAQKAKEITEGIGTVGPRQQMVTERKPEYESFSFVDDPGSNNSGLYELLAVLTHQGRSSSSGHYVAWVRRKEGEWIKLDDTVASVVTEEDILKLSGGGDWHMAYILLYGPCKLEKFTQPVAVVDNVSSMDM